MRISHTFQPGHVNHVDAVLRRVVPVNAVYRDQYAGFCRGAWQPNELRQYVIQYIIAAGGRSGGNAWRTQYQSRGVYRYRGRVNVGTRHRFQTGICDYRSGDRIGSDRHCPSGPGCGQYSVAKSSKMKKAPKWGSITIFYSVELTATRFNRISQFTQQDFGVFPTNTSIGDALAVRQRLTAVEILIPFNQVAFYHHAHNRLLAVGELIANISADFHLFFELFTAVSVAEIDHDLRWQTAFFQALFNFFYIFSAVVRFFTAAQDDVAVVVAAGADNCRMAPFGDGQEAVRCAGCVDGVDGYLNGAICAIFEAHWTGKT